MYGPKQTATAGPQQRPTLASSVSSIVNAGKKIASKVHKKPKGPSTNNYVGGVTGGDGNS